MKLPSLPENAHISDLFALFPDNVHSLMVFTDGVLRGKGELPIATRELIAAYISGLNACSFCMGSHKRYAEAFGIDENLLAALLDDLDTAPVDAGLRALLAYLRELNFLPSKLTQAKMDTVLQQGYSDKALFEAVQIAGLFNMMNRMIEGTGVNFDYDQNDTTHPAKVLGDDVRQHSYASTPMGKRTE